MARILKNNNGTICIEAAVLLPIVILLFVFFIQTLNLFKIKAL